MLTKRSFRFINAHNVHAAVMLLATAIFTVLLVQMCIKSINRASRARDELVKVQAEDRAQQLAEQDEAIRRARLPEKLRDPWKARAEENSASLAHVLDMVTVIITAQQRQLEYLESTQASSTRRGTSTTPKKTAP